MRVKFILGFSLALLFFLMMQTSAFAGDVPESALLLADNCFIGTVQKIDQTKVTIKISEVVFGEYTSDTVEILDFKYMVAIGKVSIPKKGDYCAVVVKQSQDGYRVYQDLAAKADSLDKKTLKLKSTYEFVIRMNHYINNGWYSNENFKRLNKKFKEKEASVPETSSNRPVAKEVPAKTISPEEKNSNTTLQTSGDISKLINGSTVTVCSVLLLVIVFMIMKALKRNRGQH
ncbi:MAG: hypothetical protein N2484_16350 [Clostridia bacterium]|nr:hypothetical protein [Clostridia bacterium]